MAEPSTLPAVIEPPASDDRTALVAHPAPTQLRAKPLVGLPSPEEWALLKELGTAYVESGLLPDHIKTWQAVVVTIRFGQQLGIDEWTALQDIYMVKGKPCCNSGLMHALILRDHGDDAIVPVAVTPQAATVRYKRRGWREHREHTFAIGQAETAGLIQRGSNWEKWPGQMCFARCVSQAARMAFQDTIKGMYLPDELGAPVTVTAEGIVVYDPPAGHVSATSQPAAAPAGNGHANGTGANPAWMRSAHGSAKKLGASDQHAYVREEAARLFSVVSLKELSDGDGEALAKALGWRVTIRGAATVDHLDRMLTPIAELGLPKVLMDDLALELEARRRDLVEHDQQVGRQARAAAGKG
jgi:hypothetical protein